jgi:hypothetical protein
MRSRTLGIGIMVAVALVGLSACNDIQNLQDRLKTCQDTVIYLNNSPQTIEPIYMLGPDEVFTLASRLDSGQSRPLGLCVEKGDRKRFRVFGQDGVEIAAVNCVASLVDYETQHPIVSWTPEGIHCDGW